MQVRKEIFVTRFGKDIENEEAGIFLFLLTAYKRTLLYE